MLTVTQAKRGTRNAQPTTDNAQRATRNAQRATRNAQRLYGAAFVFWLLTRLLVLVHQGAWPWMNAFVVAAARGMVVGDWNDAVRPQLPAVLGVPLVLAGASEQQTVAALYLLASVVQLGAFVILVRAVFPDRMREQTLALLVFLLLPYDHSIHHYRDVPVILASAAAFLLSAHFVGEVSRWRVRSVTAGGTPATATFETDGSTETEAARSRNSASVVRSAGASERLSGRQATVLKTMTIFGIVLLGVWSRAEFLTFVAVLALLAIVLERRRALRLALTYVAAAVLISGGLLLIYKFEDVNLSQASFYTAHTFLDSTPDSWLSPECRADPTENCREADGLAYFGPADLRAGVLALAMNHPLTTLAKSARSAWDNLWTLVGPNLSTFPGIIPFVVLALAIVRPAREAYTRVPVAVWIAVAAVGAQSVLPPLTWAPPHPQYHLQLVFPIVMLVVPILVALMGMPRGRLVALAFLIANAGLSAFRYTRYAGY